MNAAVLALFITSNWAIVFTRVAVAQLVEQLSSDWVGRWLKPKALQSASWSVLEQEPNIAFTVLPLCVWLVHDSDE